VKPGSATSLALFVLLLAAAGAALGETSALAQCAMCKASASGLDAPTARNLNYAVLVLLSPPVAIFCAIFIAAYRRREPPGDK
jgi:NADH:ubiquinone oxidoreductase subunit K